MLGQLSHKGGARLDGSGRFEVYLNAGTSKSPCMSEALKQYIRELFDFLMGPESEKQIGQRMAVKRRSAAGNTMVDMTLFDGCTIRLIRGQGEFATFIWELPFVGTADLLGADEEPAREPEDEWSALDA